MVDLEGKVVIVTGASSGIGAALSRGFSKAGARVTLAARRREKLEATAAECPGDYLAVTADVTNPQGRRDILEKTLERWGRLDILVNNAGIGAYGDFLDTTEEQWRSLFEINLFAPVLLTREALKIMQTQGEGLIINLASIGGSAGPFGQGVRLCGQQTRPPGLFPRVGQGPGRYGHPRPGCLSSPDRHGIFQRFFGGRGIGPGDT